MLVMHFSADGLVVVIKRQQLSIKKVTGNRISRSHEVMKSSGFKDSFMEAITRFSAPHTSVILIGHLAKATQLLNLVRCYSLRS